MSLVNGRGEGATVGGGDCAWLVFDVVVVVIFDVVVVVIVGVYDDDVITVFLFAFLFIALHSIDLTSAKR